MKSINQKLVRKTGDLEMSQSLKKISIVFGLIAALSVISCMPLKNKSASNLDSIREGNGGIGVQCTKTDGSSTVELLDYYEGRTQWDLEIETGDASLTADQKITYILDRMTRLDPDRANKLREGVKNFESQSRKLSGINLGPTTDSDITITEANCHPVQIVVRKEPELPGDKYFTINKDLFDKMDTGSQAGLILHELIYKEAVDHRHATSRLSRFLNANIASKKMGHISFKEYSEILKTAKFPTITAYQGIYVEIASIEVYPSGKIKSGIATHGGEGNYIIRGGQDWKNSYGSEFKFSIYGNNPVEFSEEGFLRKGTGMFDINFNNTNINFRYFLSYINDEMLCDPFILDGNRNFISCNTQCFRTLTVTGPREYQIFCPIDPDFHKTGMFKKAKYLGADRSPIQIRDKDGKDWNCNYDDNSSVKFKIVSFDENGALIPEESECVPYKE